MGLNISSLINRDISMGVTLDNFFDKKIGIDAFNIIYQFLSAIRDNRNRPLRNIDGDVTSHLSGLFYRNIKLLESNIRPIYVFDGRKKERKLRHYTNVNISRDHISINATIINSSKKLLEYMGIPCIQATGEGEAQCVYMANNGDIWGTASQDYDVLIYGGERLIRNLAIGSKRKKGDTIIKLNIEFIKLSKFLAEYNISKERLVDLSVLIGNDYFCGVKGVGAITAMKLIQKCDCFERLEFDKKSMDKGSVVLKDKSIITFSHLCNIKDNYKDMFSNPEVNRDYKIKKIQPNYDELANFLIINNNFSISRVANGIKKLKNISSKYRQSTMSDFV